jgi:histidine triad (HIT) family protein
MPDPSCIFCRIARGEIPSMKVLEDDASLAFLDISPLAEGHVLIIPKVHRERLEEMSADEVAVITRHLPRLARAVLAVTGANAYNVLQNNGKAAQQSVGHVHFHIIPRHEGDALGYRWPASSYPPGRGEELKQKMIRALGA